MIRSFFALLALLIPGLAFLFDRPWLNLVTLGVVVGSLGLLGWWLWTTYRTGEPDRPRPTPDPEEGDPSLEDFGIIDIQPQGADEVEPSAQESADVDSDVPATSPPDDTAQRPATASAPSPPTDDGAAPPAAPEDSTDRSPSSREAPVFGPLLESLRAALDARTVCLLVQEEVALTYRIEATASTHPAVRRSGTFDTQTPLLTATMSRQSVTARSLSSEEVAVEDLGYYTSPPAVDHLAVAPVPQPDASSTTFLLADAPADAALDTSRVRTLLEHFAETTALFLSINRSVPERPEGAERGTQANGQDSGNVRPQTSTEAPDGDDSPRPRREIIAEEMEAVAAADEPLALALVHLNRAESIARRGDEAVTSAEHLFAARLEQVLPNQRVERFGELTYGIFFRAATDAVEPQVADLKATMAQEEGELEGGVSVGVAVWTDRDEDPEGLRAEATEALREAYETGTPTIVA